MEKTILLHGNSSVGQSQKNTKNKLLSTWISVV